MSDTLPKDETEKHALTVSKPISHFNAPISLTHAEIPILACCLVSGLCDSSVYISWSCFVSMQTGNTVFLALGASHQPGNRPYGWLKSLTSILLFMVGCFTFAQTRRVGPLLRRTLGLSFLLQSLCIFIAAALVQSGVVPGSNHSSETADVPSLHFIELLPLAFLAFQSGGQMMASRLMGFNEIPTTVLTSVYCDLISDPGLLFSARENMKRNRRACAVVLFLVGGICGGWLTKSRVGMSAALWVSGVIKLVISVAYFCWKADE